MSERYRLGPAILVAAAFVGPGTVLAASSAGAQYGYELIWAVFFSVITAIILQSLSARLGIASGKGLAEALANVFSGRLQRSLAIALVLGAILFGNAAYQTGNLLGAASGLNMLTGIASSVWIVVVAGLAAVIIWVGRFSILQWTMTGLVALMGAVFVAAAVVANPDWSSLGQGFRPQIPVNGEWAVLALIGTTVVPYNLFLHASAAARRYGEYEDRSQAIGHSNWDTIIAVSAGGLVTAGLLVTAAISFNGQADVSFDQIHDQLKPVLGGWSAHGFAIGLFAAGLTSSITAPIAAAYATVGCFGWKNDLSDPSMKIIATAVVVCGAILALLFGSTPSQTVIVAQVANGLLLPIVAVFLLYALNQPKLVGDHRIGWAGNVVGGLVALVTVILGFKELAKAWHAAMTLFETG